MTTLNDIAKHVGVTTTTVSWVLNNRQKEKRISPSTCQRVRQAAQDLDYRPSFSAQSLAKGKTSSFGLVCGGLAYPFFAEMIDFAMHETRQRNHHLLLAATGWKLEAELEAFEMLLTRGVDGIMMYSNAVTPQTDQYRYIHRQQFPTVILGQKSGDLPLIQTDFMPGMMQAVEHLKKRGCRSVGYVGHWPASREKFPCFEQACQYHGMQASKWPCQTPHESVLATSREFAHHRNRPDAAIIIADNSAIVFMQGLFQEGLRVPDDVAVIGSDDISIGQYINPPLTTIARSSEMIVTQALDWLVEMTQQKKLLLGAELCVPTRLVVRQSA
ncbi:LacI family DNA-binding transcriptional regulator [bacterium AH-315-I18]|nr:LacI family DNA-binding transcriptional regulator [Phycisphaeraceae bacterium]MBN4060982.1 LacI family DNA-binding transcriptional regulator [bacterium AH-315-I18]